MNNSKMNRFPNPDSVAIEGLIKEQLMGKGFEERLVDAMIDYIDVESLTLDTFDCYFNFFCLEYFNENIRPYIINLEAKHNLVKSDAIVELEEILKEENIYIYIEVAVNYLLNGEPEPTLEDKIESFKKIFPKEENLVALKNLIKELAQDYVYLMRLDMQFCEDILEKRPLVALLMMMNEQIRPLMECRQDELDLYIDNYYIYKQLLPYIKIKTGTTHGDWRHLVDPKKKCFVLTAKNCQIAASEQLKRTYGESDSKFLVLQGLSMKANDDNAEVHYLEV